MHLLTDEYLEQLSEETKQIFHDYRIEIKGDDNLSLSDLQMLLAKSQWTRTLAIWHDHATILGTGYVLVTVITIYDPAGHEWRAVHIQNKEGSQNVYVSSNW